MTPIEVLRTAPHPDDPVQRLVLVPIGSFRARMNGSLCGACALRDNCGTSRVLGRSIAHTGERGEYDCSNGAWITIEEYVGWHQQKEDTS